MVKGNILRKLEERKKMFEDYLQRIKNPGERGSAKKEGENTNSAAK